mgnify:CR=1 FL=1
MGKSSSGFTWDFHDKNIWCCKQSLINFIKDWDGFVINDTYDEFIIEFIENPHIHKNRYSQRVKDGLVVSDVDFC